MSSVWDVAIAGGGATGLSLALSLRTLSRGALRVVLLDQADPALRAGPRTSALAEGPRRMLTKLGVWEGLADLAQPIVRMDISDARLSDAVKSALLAFSGETTGEPLAHMVFHRDLEPLLLTRAKESGVEVLQDTIERADVTSTCATIQTRSSGAIRARLLVGADGLRSRIRTGARIPVVAWPYDRTALVMTIAHEDEHGGVAVQHFLEGGAFASLPLVGRRSSIVWTEPSKTAAMLRTASREQLESELQARLGERFGALSIEEGPESFPLMFQIARRFVGPRLALVGDAAHRVHPLAGQGLNIGMRDVATLAELVLEQARLGLDPGSEDVLGVYEKRRRFDATASAAAFDFIHRAYDVKVPGARALRRAGMTVTDQSSWMKRLLRREASGLSGDRPELFR
ncbi:MAG: FAD-dependent monooxygenase [Beijerinckiaceae bacterium]|nr:FAD-dependent monooxygenase [Beijerinckiaceae bacterium]